MDAPWVGANKMQMRSICKNEKALLRRATLYQLSYGCLDASLADGGGGFNGNRHGSPHRLAVAEKKAAPDHTTLLTESFITEE
jgi:hypothetical protein